MSETDAADVGAQTKTKKPFQIGLTMAGAVSAGAYTAGVLDFLFEALSEWQKAKDQGSAGVPRHEVVISAISGASAGGITGALTVLAAANGVEPRELPAVNVLHADGREAGTRTVRCVLPALYDSWVKRPQLFAGGAKASSTLLDIGDLAESGVGSLLDCTLLDQIADTALSSTKAPAQRHAFLNEPLHLFLTLTNLDGMHYVVGSEQMIVHGDRAHFAVNGVGRPYTPKGEMRWLDIWKDAGIELDLTRPLEPRHRRLFRDAVLATGAFPFGLRPRAVSALSTDYDNRAWPVKFDLEKTWEERPIRPAWPSEDVAGASLNFVAVDGGTIDNEPFSYARYAIRDLGKDCNPREPEKADRAVIMIDPFPDLPVFDVKRLAGDRGKDLSLTFVIGALLPALIDQARSNLTDLLDADDPDTFSRFLVSPRRVEIRGKDRVRLRPDLASETFQAFGGFLDERFREHDFQLGRRNCQHFLRRHFILHKSNPLFDDALRSDNADDDYRVPHPRSKRDVRGEESDKHERDFRPIIPLVGTARKPCDPPPWPAMSAASLERFESGVKGRLDGLVEHLLDEHVTSALPNYFARAGWRWLMPSRLIASKIAASVESSLYWSEQLVWNGSPRPTGAKEFAVFGALADPTWDFRTLEGIKKEYDGRRQRGNDGTDKSISAEEIDSIITKFRAFVVKAPRRGSTKAMGYTLKRRRPELANPLRRLFSSARGRKFDDS